MDNLPRLESQPSGVSSEGTLLVKEGSVDGFGKLPEVALGQEEGGAVPDSLEEVEQCNTRNSPSTTQPQTGLRSAMTGLRGSTLTPIHNSAALHSGTDIS